jgi:hypothetical protein
MYHILINNNKLSSNYLRPDILLEFFEANLSIKNEVESVKKLKDN